MVDNVFLGTPNAIGGSSSSSSTSSVNLMHAAATLSLPNGAPGGANVVTTWSGQSVNQMGSTNDFGATLTCVGATIVGGGASYVVGDIITLSGGTLANASSAAATFKVLTVTSGAVTSVSPCSGSTVVANSGTYTILPGAPNAGAATTGGTGSACTLYPIGGVLVPAGYYTLDFKMTSQFQNTRARCYNYTDGTILYDSLGPNIFNWTGTGITLISGSVSKFVCSAAKVIGIQYYALGTTSTNDRGEPFSSTDGALEVYTEFLITQIKTFPSARPTLTRWFNGSISAKTINCYGDSTLHPTIAANFYSYFSSLPLAGSMTINAYGDNGQTSSGFWANSSTHGALFASTAPCDVAVWGYGLNDERTGGDAGGAALYANTLNFVNSMKVWYPNTDIVLLMPNLIGSFDTGSGYVTPNAQYQYYNNLIRQAYLAVMATNPAHTWLIDTQTLITGTLGHVDPDYLMSDQLHPSVLGYNLRATALYNILTT